MGRISGMVRSLLMRLYPLLLANILSPQKPSTISGSSVEYNHHNCELKMSKACCTREVICMTRYDQGVPWYDVVSGAVFHSSCEGDYV